MKIALQSAVVLLAVLAGTWGSVADARVLEIDFTGLDLQYNGSSILDSGSANTDRSGLRSEADSLTAVTFLLDGVQVGNILAGDIYLDVYIKDLLNIPAGGGLVTSGGSGGKCAVDLLIGTTDPAWGIGVDTGQSQVFYTGGKIAMAASAVSTGLYTQNLPFGLTFDPTQPIAVVLSSSNMSNLTTSGGYVTAFRASGTGSITGTSLPEPASLVLLSLSFLGLLRRQGMQAARWVTSGRDDETPQSAPMPRKPVSA